MPSLPPASSTPATPGSSGASLSFASGRGVVGRWPHILLGLILAAGATAAAAPAGRHPIFESPAPASPAGPIDRHVFAGLARAGLEPVLCSDAVFLRRAYLDVLGILPTAQEAREFLQDPDASGKRARLIDRLLARDEFADYWSMKWGDVLRIKAEFPVNLWPNAAQAYHRWLRASLAANKPYDRFVRELLTSSGSNFRVGPVNFYRAIQNRTPDGIAGAVALAFLGSRTDTWPAERRAGLAAFFAQVGYKPTSEWKEEHVFWDPLGLSTVAGNTAPGRAALADVAKSVATTPATLLPAADTPKPPTAAMFPDGRRLPLPPDRDPREVFADWLITPDNPWFARAIVNRVWGWLVGRGIVHEPDDIRPDNPPSHPELLAYLERDFVASRYDLKALYRTILNSQTYQLSSVPRTEAPAAEAAFAAYPLRRLEAEVLIDAINAITGTTDLYTSPIPEPFTYIPANLPAVAIADGSITSPFLALFGRSPRATGMACERDNKPIPAQWLHLLNSSHIQRKLENGPKLRALLDPRRPSKLILEELYLTILSRLPTPEEIKVADSLGVVPAARSSGGKAVKTTSGQATPAKATGGKVPAAKVTPAKTAKSAPAIKAAAATGKARAAAAATPALFKRREDWVDLAWALINSTEFLYRH